MNFFNGEIISDKKDGIVEVKFGNSIIRTLKPVTDRKKITLAVRPEDLFIEITKRSNLSGESTARIEGRVIKSSFTGALIQYFVECENGVNIIVERHKPEKDALISGGTDVFIDIPAKAVLLFDPETGESIRNREQRI